MDTLGTWKNLQRFVCFSNKLEFSIFENILKVEKPELSLDNVELLESDKQAK